MQLVKNFFWNVGYQVFILIVPLLTIPYISRVLGPVGVGVNSYTNSIVQYFILFGSLGITTYGNREVAYKRDSKEEVSKTFWEISILRFITIGISIVCYLLFVSQVTKYKVFYFAQGISLIGAAFDISWFFMGMENFKVTVLRNSAVKIISLVLIFVFVKSADDTGLYILILSLSQLIGFITLWPYLKRYLVPIRVKSLNLFKHVRPSVALLIPQIATQIYLQLNKTMLGVFSGVTSSGFYDNSDKIIKVVLAIVTASGTVLLPHVSHSFARGDHQAVRQSLVISMHVILVLAFPMAFGLAAISQPFTDMFFGRQFTAVGKLMAVESAVIVLIGISSAIGTQYLLPTNQLRTYTSSVIIGSVVNVILNIPLILLFGTMGAITATVLSEASVSLYQVYKVRNQIRIGELFAGVWKYLLSSVSMYLLIIVISNFLNGGVIAIIIEVLAGIILYVAVLFILRPRILFGYVSSFLQR